MKRILAFVLCLALVLGVMPMALAEETEPTQATEPTTPTETTPTEPTPTEPEETEVPTVSVRPDFTTPRPGYSETDLKMEALAWDVFDACKKSARKTSFHGYCGNFVSHQLFNMGINRYLSTRHGKDHFDYYSKLKKTTGGYFPKGISAEEIHLTGALNYITDNGSRDVYNVLVGFDWTHTEAGQKYGHVVLIYGIVGGTVYFSESFDLYYKWKTYPEGSLIKLSIEEFVDYYDGWTQYEGLVTLSTQDYSESCKQVNTNLTVQARFDTTLRSQPCQLGKNKSQLLRNVSAGERLLASGVFTNANGEVFYRIADGELTGYVSANAVCVLQANAFNSYIQDINLPQVLPEGHEFALMGTVAGEYAKVRAVTVQLVDSENRVVQEVMWENFSNQLKLEAFSDKLKFEDLSRGYYTLKIFGDVKCQTADGDLLEASAMIGGVYFCIGGEDFTTRAVPKLQYFQEADVLGWQYQDGWYFYEDGVPKTGWVTWCGVQYYFDELGRAVTGWVTLEDRLHYFSRTGALVKNSRITEGKSVYEIDSQGVATKVKK